MPAIWTAFNQGLAANRPAAATSNQGYVWLSTDVNGGTLYQSTGSAWVQLAPGVSQAGFSNPMTTQDDLIVGGSSGTAARLAKGSDSQVLTVDPSTHHLVWATPAAGGMSDPTT